MIRNHARRMMRIGMLRIYPQPGDKASPRTARKLWSARTLYSVLVMRARADGLLNAVARQTHYGFSNHGSIRENGSRKLMLPEVSDASTDRDSFQDAADRVPDQG